jgi:hypothetical protein
MAGVPVCATLISHKEFSRVGRSAQPCRPPGIGWVSVLSSGVGQGGRTAVLVAFAGLSETRALAFGVFLVKPNLVGHSPFGGDEIKDGSYPGGRWRKR